MTENREDYDRSKGETTNYSIKIFLIIIQYTGPQSAMLKALSTNTMAGSPRPKEQEIAFRKDKNATKTEQLLCLSVYCEHWGEVHSLYTNNLALGDW